MTRPTRVVKRHVFSNNTTFPAQGLLLPPPTACINIYAHPYLTANCIITSHRVFHNSKLWHRGGRKMLRDSKLASNPSSASPVSLNDQQGKNWGFIIEQAPPASTPIPQPFLLQSPRRKCNSEHHSSPAGCWEQPGQHSRVLQHTSPHRPHVIISLMKDLLDFCPQAKIIRIW